jgi:hypothetical protein
MLSIVMLSVVMPNVFMLNVVVPGAYPRTALRVSLVFPGWKGSPRIKTTKLGLFSSSVRRMVLIFM